MHALRGAQSLIAGGRTTFLIEFHPHLIGDFGHKAEDLLACIPENWQRDVLQDDGTTRPVTAADRNFAHDPYLENIKLLFRPPAT